MLSSCLGPFELLQRVMFEAKEMLQTFGATHIAHRTLHSRQMKKKERNKKTYAKFQILIDFRGLFEMQPNDKTFFENDNMKIINYMWHLMVR